MKTTALLSLIFLSISITAGEFTATRKMLIKIKGETFS